MTSSTSFEQGSGVLVCGLGAVTAVGLTAWESAAAVRAGLSGFEEHPFMVDSVGEPMRVAQCPLVASNPLVARRIGDCLVTAVRESLSPLHSDTRAGSRTETTLLVNLPPQRTGLDESLPESVQATLQQAFPGVFARISITQLGHAGSQFALQSALHTLSRNPAQACVVAGSDSYLDPDTLEWLEETDQVHGAGPRNNAWGFVPGEGAGAILLASASLVRRAGVTPFGRITAVGVGSEINRIRTDTICLGEGLTTAFRAAFEGLPIDQVITDVYCDMNGETYRADEFGFTVARTRERFVAATDFVAPADCWGDVGAASTALLIILSCISFLKSYSNGRTALSWTSSDTGERGAAILEAVGGE